MLSVILLIVALLIVALLIVVLLIVILLIVVLHDSRSPKCPGAQMTKTGWHACYSYIPFL